MKTKIEYVSHTVNPIRVRGGKVWPHGYHCTKISPGCANCYAEPLNIMRGTGLPYDNRKVEFYLDLSVFDKLPKTKPAMVLVQSMGDLFHKHNEFERVYKVFEKMLIYDLHTYIVLTKRQNILERTMPHVWYFLKRNYPDKTFPLPNVIGMVTGENQDMIDLRVPALLRSPFAIRGVSIEPMLGEIELDFHCCKARKDQDIEDRDHRYCQGDNPTIDWVIIGAESGPGKRYCDTENMITLARQCDGADTPVFIKQIHLWKRLSRLSDGFYVEKNINKFPLQLQYRQYPESIEGAGGG